MSEIPVSLVHVCDCARDRYHLSFGYIVVQDLGILMLGLADDVHCNIQTQCLCMARLQQRLTAELRRVKVQVPRSQVDSASVDLKCSSRQSITILDHVQKKSKSREHGIGVHANT